MFECGKNHPLLVFFLGCGICPVLDSRSMVVVDYSAVGLWSNLFVEWWIVCSLISNVDR